MKTEKSSFNAFDTLKTDAFYLIDYNKVKTIEDVKAIFEAIAFNFVGNHPRINTVKHLLDLKNPLVPPAEYEVETDLSKLDELETEEYGPGL
jgi:hypothetical protein